MKIFYTAIMGLFALMLTTEAWAKPPAGKFRLQLDSSLLEIGTGETKADGSDNKEHYGGVNVGLGVTRGGLGMGISLGRGFVLGTKFTVGQHSSNWIPGNDDESFNWGVVPYLEYIFLTGGVRPFIKAHIGLEGIKADNFKFWGLLFGGGGGLHFFAHPAVSIDLGMDITMRAGGGNWNTSASGGDFNHWRFSFGILFGLSGWF